jgi:hypothetical protein
MLCLCGQEGLVEIREEYDEDMENDVAKSGTHLEFP